MKILHCCLGSSYLEGYNYQENIIPTQNKADGHDVMILASTEVFINNDNRKMGYTNPTKYMNKNGITVIRVPYRKVICDKITHKFRAYKNVYSIIEDFSPDVILFHGTVAWELRTVCRYTKRHSSVQLYVDVHASEENSGKNWISKNILHGLFYRMVVHSALPYVKKVLCITNGCMDFAKKVYKVPEDKLELFLLGGIVLGDKQYFETREKIHRELKVSPEQIIFLHSGKMDSEKKTCELLESFARVKDNRFRLFIVGRFSDDISRKAEQLISEDNRVQFLGWKSGEELLELLCAADMYLQPGSVSATLQNAMCLRCAIMVKNTIDYEVLVNNNGFMVKDMDDMSSAFAKISKNPEIVEDMKGESLKIAKEFLDYKKIAARLYV